MGKNNKTDKQKMKKYIICQVMVNASKKINKSQGTERDEGQLFKKRCLGKFWGDIWSESEENGNTSHTNSTNSWGKNFLGREDNVYKVQEAGMSWVSLGVGACLD